MPARSSASRRKCLRGSILAFAACAFLGPPALAQPVCTPAIAPSRFPDVNGRIMAVTQFDDDGDGAPSIFITGEFTRSDGVIIGGVAKYADRRWNAIGQPVTIRGRSFLTYDDGNGPRLYVGGEAGVHRLDPSGWTQIGASTVGAQGLIAHDDGSGRTIYATARLGNVQRLVNGAWQIVRDVNGRTFSAGQGLIEFDDDGAGPLPPRLFAFGSAMGFPDNPQFTGIVRWDGTTLTPLYTGRIGSSGFTYGGWIKAAVVADVGGGPHLHLGAHGGSFGLITNLPVISWTGTTLASVGPNNSQSTASYGLAAFEEIAGRTKVLYSRGDSGVYRVPSASPSAQGPVITVGGNAAVTGYSTFHFLNVDAHNGAPAKLYTPVYETSTVSRLGILAGCPRLDSDFNLDGRAGIDDVFEYLEYFFDDIAHADMDRDGRVDIDDIFVYLNIWFNDQ